MLSAAETIYCDPLVDDAVDITRLEPGQGEIVVGMEDEDIGCAVDGLGSEEGMGGVGGRRDGRGQDGREVVWKGKGAAVDWVLLADGAGVAGTEVAGGIVRGEVGRLGGLELAEPGTLVAVRRDEDELVRERVDCGDVIMSAVWVVCDLRRR